MQLQRGDVDGNRGGKHDAVPKPFHLEIRENRIFLAGYIREADDVVLGQIFHSKLR